MLQALARAMREYGELALPLARRARRVSGEAEVHRLRVLTRRLRVLLGLLQSEEADKRSRRARRRLRRLGRALGERRMWDVALADLPRLEADGARFERRRDAATRALSERLERMDLRELRRDLAAAQERLYGLSKAELAAQAQKLRAPLAAALRRPPVRSSARHALRIRVKKARYLLEACGIAAPGARRLQDRLGREHDLQVLIGLLGRLPRLRAQVAVARAAADRAMRRSLRETADLLDALARPDAA